jgi:hypothetical protein
VTELRPETPKESSSTSDIGHANAFPEREYIHLNVGRTLSEQIADYVNRELRVLVDRRHVARQHHVDLVGRFN